MNENESTRVDCFKCIYFEITWNNTYPKSCKFHGFKSAEIPSATVFRSSGAECLAFVKKAPKKL